MRGATASNYPNYFYTPKENVFESKRGSRYDKGQPKAFHLTQPDNDLAKFVFMTQEGKNKRPGDSQSMINAYNPRGRGDAAFTSIYSVTNGGKPHKSPQSQVAYKSGTAGNQRGFLQSQQSMDSDNTIQAFMMKDSCGQIVKTKKILERE